MCCCCCQDEHNPRKTKIVCTLGPSCWGEEGLGQLMDAGMNVARFNFSHGDHAGHGEVCPDDKRQQLDKV
jgi:pyruvate kinase